MSKLVIGLAGSIGAGKGTAAAYLVRKYGADMFIFSSPLRNILKTLYIEPSRTELQKLSKALREVYGSGILSQVAIRAIEESEHRIVVIDGVRRISDLDGIRENPNFKLLYIDADVQTRYERILSRAQNSWDSEKTFEQFLVEEDGETEVSIRTLKPYASCLVENNKTEAEFYTAIDAFVEENLPKSH